MTKRDAENGKERVQASAEAAGVVRRGCFDENVDASDPADQTSSAAPTMAGEAARQADERADGATPAHFLSGTPTFAACPSPGVNQPRKIGATNAIAATSFSVFPGHLPTLCFQD